ncbi:MAG: OmpA family protein, partial [Alphaproteobacteria bacterium]|nr:OmpA family protein [Alphaproteobacteria bacterium]
VLAAARKVVGAGTVTDATTLAAGAPQGFAGMAAHGAGLAGQLIEGKFTLDGAVYSLSGRAPAPDAFPGLEAAARALPAGAQAGTISVLPALANPYAFSARQGGDGRVTLSGFVPGQKERAAIVATAEKWFPNAVYDRLQIAAGEPAGFTDAANAGIAQMARLQNGGWALGAGAWALSGEAPSQDTANGITAAMRKALASADTTGVKAPPPPPPPPVVEPPKPAPAPVVEAPKPPPAPVVSCAPGSEGFILREVIRFDTADRRLTDDDIAILNRVLERIRACPGARLELHGHTDARGGRGYNISLSSRRAFSTSRYFVTNGVDRKRITTLGYGKDKPIADNATDEGRTQNRRVEVFVK